MSRNKIVVIIGAGPAGLTAAYKLLTETNDIKPIIFETDREPGGIAKTLFYKGNGIDLGGHRLFSKNNDIKKLWLEFLPLNKNTDENENIMLIRKRFSEILYDRKLFDYPIKLSFKTFKNMGLKKTFKSGIDYIKSSLFKRKELTLEDFIINRFGKALYSMFFEGYTEKVWGRHPNKISKEWGEQRIKSLSLSKVILNALHLNGFHKETSLIDKFWYPKYGCGQLWNLMSDKIISLGGEIHYNCPVINIENSSDTIKTVMVNKNGNIENINCTACFSSMPIKDLLNIMCNTPSEILSISNNLPYRDYMLVGLELNNINLKDKNGNLTNDCWIYIQDERVKAGRIQIMNNWSPYLVRDKNKIFISVEYFCNENDRFWNMDDNTFINFAISEMVKIDIIEPNYVEDSTRIKVKKAYPAYFDTYTQFDEIKTYLNKFDNLYCIGRNGQHRYNNIDHSMLTAIYAVNSYINGTDKNKIWNVNSEKDYHETK